jgi:antitoxin component of MazEF toxin-antitoxin module
MTYQNNITLPTEILEQIAEEGLDVLPELIRLVINTTMQFEWQNLLRQNRMNAPQVNFNNFQRNFYG